MFNSLKRNYTLVAMLILLVFGAEWSKQPQAVADAQASSTSISSDTQNQVAGWNGWESNHALFKVRSQEATTQSVDSSDTTVAPDTGRNFLLFGEWDTGKLRELAGGQLNDYFADSSHDLGFVLDIQISGRMVYVSSVDRQQEYQILSRFTDGVLNNQWPGLMGGIGLLPISQKRVLSGGTGRTIYPYKVNSSLSLPSSEMFPAYNGKSAIKFARNSEGDIYVLDAGEGALYKVKSSPNSTHDWQNKIILSKDYARAVQIAIDEQDRIILGIAGVENEPLSTPRTNESRVVLLEDLEDSVSLVATKIDKSIRLQFGPQGGLVAANGEVDVISTSNAKNSIVRIPYDGNGFGEAQLLFSTDRTISGLAVRNRR